MSWKLVGLGIAIVAIAFVAALPRLFDGGEAAEKVEPIRFGPQPERVGAEGPRKEPVTQDAAPPASPDEVAIPAPPAPRPPEPHPAPSPPPQPAPPASPPPSSPATQAPPVVDDDQAEAELGNDDDGGRND